MLVCKKVHFKPDVEIVYQLMVEQNFPNVPDTFEVAWLYLKDQEIYGIYSGCRMVAAFVLGAVENNSRFLDVVCAPDFHGKWATKSTLRKLFQTAFEPCVDCVWVEAYRESSIKSAITAGFEKVHQESDVPYFLLSKEKAQKKYLN